MDNSNICNVMAFHAVPVSLAQAPPKLGKALLSPHKVCIFLPGPFKPALNSESTSSRCGLVPSQRREHCLQHQSDTGLLSDRAPH